MLGPTPVGCKPFLLGRLSLTKWTRALWVAFLGEASHQWTTIATSSVGLVCAPYFLLFSFSISLSLPPVKQRLVYLGSSQKNLEDIVVRSIALLALVMMCQVALAETLTGTVRGPQGQPISNAVLEVVGANIRTRANALGEFRFEGLPDRSLELHIKATGFAHKIFHIDSPADGPLNLSLSRTVLETVDVIGLPWHASNMESAQPVSVLSGERLRERQAATLGETLKYELGVHSNYYGPVASSPIIRGLEGPRVKVTQNGLDVGDASRVGPDHAVATETTVAQQVEVLRGPATLFYGSGAIGGVVNIVDNRVPRSNETEGRWLVEHHDVANENLVSGSLTTGIDRFAVHLDGYWREAGDYRIPVPAEVDDHDHGDHDHNDDHGHGHYRLANSAHDARGFNLGGSYLFDQGFAGVSFGRLERNYGIPGHSHGDGDDDVYAELQQDRIQVISELALDHNFFSAVNGRLGYTDYTHSEVEEGMVVTTFDNKTLEARVDLFHHAISDWRGALSLHYLHSDFSAEGLEAFTPPSTTETFAIALMEERHFGDLLVQLGARLEQVQMRADRFMVDRRLREAHGDHYDVHGDEISVYSVDHTSTPISLSAGAVWDFTPGYNVALSLTHAQRTPSAAELTAFGPHIGTGLFEVGALLVVEDEPDGFRFDLARTPVELEKSNNIDLSLRKYSGDTGFILNAFFNEIDNFYYLGETQYTMEFEHDHDHGHDHDHSHDHAHAEELPVFVYRSQDARLYGFEGQFIWQALDDLKLTLSTDYTRGRLQERGGLPRIPPLRAGGQLNYQRDALSAELSVRHMFEQNKLGAMETPGESYTMVDAMVSYQWPVAQQNITVYLKGNNLTDEEARVHASFLKDIAPKPGRGFALGVRGTF